jgi:hypothetical protein
MNKKIKKCKSEIVLASALARSVREQSPQRFFEKERYESDGSDRPGRITAGLA